MSFKRLLGNQNGVGIIQAVSGIAITSVIMVGMLHNQSTVNRMTSSLKTKSDVLSIANTFNALVDCTRTLPSGVCSPGAKMALLKADGSELLSNQGGRFGDLTVGAKCADTGSSLSIRVMKLKGDKPIFSTNSDDYYIDKNRGIAFDEMHPLNFIMANGKSNCFTPIVPGPPPPLPIPTGAAASDARLTYDSNGKGSPPCTTWGEFLSCYKLGYLCQSGKTYFHENYMPTSAKRCGCHCR